MTLTDISTVKLFKIGSSCVVILWLLQLGTAYIYFAMSWIPLLVIMSIFGYTFLFKINPILTQYLESIFDLKIIRGPLYSRILWIVKTKNVLLSELVTFLYNFIFIVLLSLFISLPMFIFFEFGNIP